MQKYRLTYDPGTGELVTWIRTAEELLVPNGPNETLLDYLLRTCDERGLPIMLETFEER
jgi:hypothetical protein